MSHPPLRVMTRTCGANSALVHGEVALPGTPLEFERVDVLVHGFRRMVRELAFDVSEMALTTYLCAREHGVAFTALPIPLVRGLHHGAILRSAAAEPVAARSLEGRRVGVNRGYTVTTGVWARAILQEEHDVRLDRVTWVRSGDEHVAAYQPPSNVVAAPAGRDLSDLVVSGDLAAAINLKGTGPGLVPFVADPMAAGLAAVRDRGFYPINHVVVVRDELLAERPELAVELFEAFAAAKRRYVDRLAAGDPGLDGADDEVYRRVMEATGGDPLPYGLAPNRPVLEELVRHAVTQGILAEPVDPASLFAEATLDLTG